MKVRRRLMVSMRTWLGLVLALVVAFTAAAVAYVFLERFENVFREQAAEVAAGYAVRTAIAVAEADSEDASLERVLENAETPSFVFGRDGELLTSPRSQGVGLAALPTARRAVATALDGRRYVETTPDGRATLVALPLFGERAGAVLTYTRNPQVKSGLALAREEILRAVLWGIVVGAAAGFAVAAVIAQRLRRIAAAAREIEKGDFDHRLRPGFPDELGRLAATIDRMRERLRASFAAVDDERTRLHRLLERLHEGIVVVDRDLNVELANVAARRLFAPRRLDDGYPLVEPWTDFSLGRFAARLFEPGARVAEAVVSQDEEKAFTIVGVPPSHDSDTAILVVEDVSERERRERAEREFVTNAAHELRTPLTTITSAVSLLQTGAKEVPRERDRLLDHVDREVTRLTRLVRALLVLARAQTREETPRLEPVELRPLLASVAAALHPAEGVSVGVDCPEHLTAVTDPDLLAQAVANLAENAAKYTERGRIDLAARALATGGVAVEVRDTGPGIPPGAREHVFERFYRVGARDAGGFGLGLALVRQIARALRAVIDVESTPGEGTTVRLTLREVEARAA